MSNVRPHETLVSVVRGLWACSGRGTSAALLVLHRRSPPCLFSVRLRCVREHSRESLGHFGARWRSGSRFQSIASRPRKQERMGRNRPSRRSVFGGHRFSRVGRLQELPLPRAVRQSNRIYGCGGRVLGGLLHHVACLPAVLGHSARGPAWLQRTNSHPTVSLSCRRHRGSGSSPRGLGLQVRRGSHNISIVPNTTGHTAA